jgi:hypothetical protein
MSHLLSSLVSGTAHAGHDPSHTQTATSRVLEPNPTRPPSHVGLGPHKIPRRPLPARLAWAHHFPVPTRHPYARLNPLGWLRYPRWLRQLLDDIICGGGVDALDGRATYVWMVRYHLYYCL